MYYFHIFTFSLFKLQVAGEAAQHLGARQGVASQRTVISTKDPARGACEGNKYNGSASNGNVSSCVPIYLRHTDVATTSAERINWKRANEKSVTSVAWCTRVNV